MTDRPRAHHAPALVLFAIALSACGGGMEARPDPKPAGAVAYRQAGPAGDACGTFERPCMLQEIRVRGSAAE